MRPLIPFAAALLALIVATSPVAAATERVNVGDDYFSPATAVIARGDRIEWKNVGYATHTVTYNGSLDYWVSKTLDRGEVGYQTFPAAGAYPYLCVIHAGQSGRVKVPISLSRSGGEIRITVASASQSGFRSRVHRKKGANGAWRLVGTTTGTAIEWAPPSSGTYYFRSRLERISDGGVSSWSPVKSISW